MEAKKIKLHEVWYEEDKVYSDEYSCYLVDKIPNERDYFDYGQDKGYVISIVEDSILENQYHKYTIYYEKNLDDWATQKIEVAEVCSICIKD